MSASRSSARAATRPSIDYKAAIDRIVETGIYLQTESRRLAREQCARHGITATQLNDVLAFLGGKRFGRHRWTALSPNKTIEGSLVALAGTLVLAFAQWPIAFPHLPWHGVLAAGLIVALGGQVGDLTMALIKRNAGVKDFGVILPGHGGVTDRTNSLMITAPAFTHAIGSLYGPT